MVQYLNSLNRPDRKQAELILTKIAPNLAASEDLEWFASYVLTKDEHKQGDESVRPFPTRTEKAYVWDVLDSFKTEKLILVEKSRQLMLTWLCCLYALWMAKYQKNRLIFIQSRKEESAAALVYRTEPNQARISFMETNLPEEMRSKVTWSYGNAIFHETGSSIQAIPEGGDQIRSSTPSLVVSDEAAFQPEFEGAWKAIKPCIDGGGQLICVSTPKNGSYMKQLLRTTGYAA
jgi:phage FluMu gp28-like protein